MPVGTTPRAARMLVEYWSGSAWTSLASSSGTSRVLTIEITDNLNAPRIAIVTLFNPRTSSSNIFETGDFDTVLKNKMKIRITDQATKTILFLGRVDDVAPENTLRGYTVTVTAYDSLIELQQNILKKDTLNDAARGEKPAIGKNDFISEDVGVLIDFGSYNQGTGNRSIEIVNTTDSDDTGAHRFQTSLGKMTTKDKDFSKSGGNFLNAVKRLGELEAGIESTASGAITGGLKPYNLYVDTNFKTTATNTEGSDNFFNYFPAGCMPAAAQSGTSYTVANAADDGLTLVFGTGSGIIETGQTLKMLPSFAFEDIARERVTHLNAHFTNPISGYAEDIEFEVFNYKAISNGGDIQNLYEPTGTGTGGTETSKTITQGQGGVFDAASGGNNVGFLQYLSNTGGAGYALLSGTTGDAGTIRHTVAAGEQLHIRNAGGTTVGTITLSDTTDSNGSDIFRPQEVFKQKILRNFSVNTGDLLTIRRAIAAAFANKDTRRVRGSFSMASGYPYHFVEGQVNSVSTNTITDSTIVNQHATTTDGLAAANIDSFPTAGIRTGMVLHKLTGVGGTMAEYGYIEKTEDNSLTADLTNSATFSTNDYYRTYIPLRAGHTVQIKNLAINSSPFNHVVTSIHYTEGEKGFMTNIDTVGDIGNVKATTAGARIDPSTPPIVYDDEAYSEGVPLAIQKPTFTGTIEPGRQADSNHKNTSIKYSDGTLTLDGKEYAISADDSEDATTGINGEFADDTDYIISFDPKVSETKLIIKSDTDFKNQAVTAAGGSGNDASAFQGDKVRLGTANKASHSDAEASFQITHAELPGSNFKFDKESISAKSLTAGEIKANTITAGEIAANTITAAQITAGTITATEIAAGTLSLGGSSATSGTRFVMTHPNAQPSGAGTDFFRAYKGSNSSSNSTGFWFNLDSHNESIQITDGAASPTVLVTIDETGVEFSGGTFAGESGGAKVVSAANATFNDGSSDRLRIGASSASGYNVSLYMPQSANTMRIGGEGAGIVAPHNTSNILGTRTHEWEKVFAQRFLISSVAAGADDAIVGSDNDDHNVNRVHLGFTDSAGSASDTFGQNDEADHSDTGIYYRAGGVGIASEGAGIIQINSADSSGVHVMHVLPAHATQNGSGAGTPFVQYGTTPSTFGSGGTRGSQPFNLFQGYYHAAGAGSAAAPSLYFYDDAGTGFYRYGEDDIGITANGTVQAVISNQFYFAGDADSFGGGYTFLNDNDTLIHNPSANRIDINTNNALNAIFTQNGSGHGSIYVGDSDGFGGDYAFSNDADTFITNPSADLMRIVVGGDTLAEFRESGGSYFTGINQSFNGSYNFIVAGSVAKTSAGTTWTSTSDDRIKENNTSIANATATLKTLDPISYNWKSPWKNAIDGESYTLHGFTASDYESTFADFVTTSDIKLIQKADNSYRTGDTVESGETAVYEDLKFINTDSLVPHLVAAIKELDARIASLEGG
mgnify:FL=1